MAKDLLNFVNILEELPCTVPNRNLLSLLRDKTCIKNETDGLKQWTTLLKFQNKFDLLLDEMLLINLTKNCEDPDKRMDHFVLERAANCTENLLNVLLASVSNFHSIYFKIDGFSSLVKLFKCNRFNIEPKDLTKILLHLFDEIKVFRDTEKVTQASKDDKDILHKLEDEIKYDMLVLMEELISEKLMDLNNNDDIYIALQLMRNYRSNDLRVAGLQALINTLKRFNKSDLIYNNINVLLDEAETIKFIETKKDNDPMIKQSINDLEKALTEAIIHKNISEMQHDELLSLLLHFHSLELKETGLQLLIKKLRQEIGSSLVLLRIFDQLLLKLKGIKKEDKDVDVATASSHFELNVLKEVSVLMDKYICQRLPVTPPERVVELIKDFGSFDLRILSIKKIMKFLIEEDKNLEFFFDYVDFLFKQLNVLMNAKELTEAPYEIRLLVTNLKKEFLPYVQVYEAITQKMFIKRKFLFCIKSFQTTKHKIEGLKYLIDIIKHFDKIDDPEVLEIAFAVKKLSESSENRFQADLKELRAKFPESIQNLIWERVHLQNVHWNAEFGWQTYLCANTFGNVFYAPNQDQKLYLSIMKRKPNEGAEWIFDSMDEGQTFIIKNALTSESLFATPRTFNYWNGSRKCHMAFASTGNEFKWKITSECGATKFLFENKLYDELFRSNTNIYSEGKQYVFAWNGIWDGCYWKIDK